MADHDHADHDHVEENEPGTDPATIDADFVPLVRHSVASVELDGETVLLDEGTGQTHLLNPTATIVWQCFDGSGSIEELVADLAEAFGADPDVIRADVVRLAQDLGQLGLLEGVTPKHTHTRPSQPTGLPVGADVPAFELPDLDGRLVTSASLAGRQVLLVNWNPGCGYCARIAPDLASLHDALRAKGVELVLACMGAADANRELVEAHGLTCPALLATDAPLEVFRNLGTPAAYLLDEDFQVAEPLALGAVDVPRLAAAAAGRTVEDIDHH